MAYNILKEDELYTLTDYQKLKLSEQYDKLYNLSRIENRKRYIENQKNLFYNLSINDLVVNFSNDMVDIVNELTNFIMNNTNKNINNFMAIFVKNTRLIHVGFLFILISLMLYFISNTI
jgi:hypothetical protein